MQAGIMAAHSFFKDLPCIDLVAALLAKLANA